MERCLGRRKQTDRRQKLCLWSKHLYDSKKEGGKELRQKNDMGGNSEAK